MDQMDHASCIIVRRKASLHVAHIPRPPCNVASRPQASALSLVSICHMPSPSGVSCLHRPALRSMARASPTPAPPLAPCPVFLLPPAFTVPCSQFTARGPLPASLLAHLRHSAQCITFRPIITPHALRPMITAHALRPMNSMTDGRPRPLTPWGPRCRTGAP